MPRQAITARMLNPTNYRGPRVKASCNAGSVVLGWDHGLSDEDNYWAAATALVVKLRWNTEAHARNWVMGWLPKGFKDSAVFVCSDA